ncbi:MAG: prephenate dehydrogenase/arogenate dehydrogenase family protein [Synechococcaceae cyanobacterium ELA263]
MTALWQRRPVGIVGLGLIGGSLGLDLLARGATVRALVHRQATADRALERGLASAVSTDPELLRDCGLVVLALPLDLLLDPPPQLLASLPPGAVITDVGSVKAPVLQAWTARLGPERASRFVASHPMAGTARAGVEAGLAGLFRGRPWVATPIEATDPSALAAVSALAEAVGARWLTCGAADHDRAVALISHLPVLVSAALLQAADRGGAVVSATGRPAAGSAGAVAAGERADAALDPGVSTLSALVRGLASSGFADTTRVGGGNPELGTLMARGNRQPLLAALAQYRQALAELEQLVTSESWPDLQAALAEAQRLRPEFL